MEMLTTTIKVHIGQLLIKGVSAVHVKIPLVALFLIGDFLIGAENFTTMGMLLILIIFDFITSIMAKYKGDESIESRKALKTVTKILVYTIFVSGAVLTERIIPGSTFLHHAAISFLAITELISIIENIGDMGFAIPKRMLNRLEELRKTK